MDEYLSLFLTAMGTVFALFTTVEVFALIF